MLKQDTHERTWFFDLEWVPDAVAAKRLFDLPDETTELEAMQKLWENTSGYSYEVPRPFVKYLYSRVVSVAFLSRNVVFRDGRKEIDFAIHSLPKLPTDRSQHDEADIIGTFLHWVGERQPQLVGFNSLESDLQVLVQRALVNEVSAPGFASRPAKPWEGRDYFDSRNSEWHLDLIQKFSQRGGMTPRLNDLAVLCGYPGKIDMAGDQVVDLWLAGDVNRIVEYNQTDAFNTYLVWLRVAFFSGKLTEDDYIAEQETFRAFLEAEAGNERAEHIAKFVEMWQM
jgi:predicted PolB exonuclease-like 3'-5' exonuclease